MSAFGANRMTAPVAMVDRITMLAISQKPDRVSNILRTSTPMTVRIGIGAYVGRSPARVTSVTALAMVAVLAPGAPAEAWAGGAERGRIAVSWGEFMLLLLAGGRWWWC